MSLEYRDNGKTYSFSYSDLREHYQRYRAMTDDEFFKRKTLTAALHFAVYASFIKELPTSMVLSDEGLIHQMVHHLHIGKESYIKSERRACRAMFDKYLEFV